MKKKKNIRCSVGFYMKLVNLCSTKWFLSAMSKSSIQIPNSSFFIMQINTFSRCFLFKHLWGIKLFQISFFFFFFNKGCLIFLYSAWQQMEIMIFSLGYDCGMIQYLTKQLFPTMLIFMLFGSSKENYTCLKILSSR